MLEAVTLQVSMGNPLLLSPVYTWMGALGAKTKAAAAGGVSVAGSNATIWQEKDAVDEMLS